MNNPLSDHIFDNLTEKQLSNLHNCLITINNNLENLLNNKQSNVTKHNKKAMTSN